MTSASHAEGRQFDPGLVYFGRQIGSPPCISFIGGSVNKSRGWVRNVRACWIWSNALCFWPGCLKFLRNSEYYTEGTDNHCRWKHRWALLWRCSFACCHTEAKPYDFKLNQTLTGCVAFTVAALRKFCDMTLACLRSRILCCTCRHSSEHDKQNDQLLRVAASALWAQRARV